jgi:2'-5' RNA ligase
MSRGALARLFVAVDPPPQACVELVAWTRGASAGLGLRAGTGGRPPLRLLAPDTLHLTVCFLGSRPVAEIEPIAAALGSRGGPVGELRVGGPLWLPPRRPRSLAVEVHDEDGELTALQAGVSSAIAAVSGWEPERRRFRAHITLARIGARAVLRSSRDEPSLPATPPLRFRPAALILYRSWLSPAGASYEPLASCDLAPTTA